MPLPRARTRLVIISAVLLFAGGFAAPALALEPKTFELQNGRWPQVTTTAPTTQPLPDPTLVRAEQLIDNTEYSAARKRLVDWVRHNKGSPLFDRALFLMAKALYGYGDRIKSFFYLDELLDEYPESPLYYRALEMQYQIADGFLNGYKSRFLGIAFLDREDEGVEMLYRIQQRSPGSPLAERSLLRTSNYYFANRDYDFASDAYGEYIRRYPRSPEVPQVRLRQAYANLAQARGIRFDATPVVDARTELLDLSALYPETAREQNISELLDRIDQFFAAKLYATGDYYRRTHQQVAAVYMYRYLIRTYPQSPEAQRAQRDMNRMPEWALKTPPPGRSVFAQPSTQPLSSARD